MLDHSNADDTLIEAVAEIEEKGEIAYGDELKKAAEWIAADIAVPGAKIYVTGAYGGKGGCVPAIVEHLCALGLDAIESPNAYDLEKKVPKSEPGNSFSSGP
jgi:hypothetical protein